MTGEAAIAQFARARARLSDAQAAYAAVRAELDAAVRDVTQAGAALAERELSALPRAEEVA